MWEKFKSQISSFLNLPWIYGLSTYSQDNEDTLLKKIFKNRKQGFYVDIGAHHPFRYSNTYLLYKKGWRGINIDADKNAVRLLRRNRKYDINLNIAVASQNSVKNLYVFSDPALNTLSVSVCQKIIQSGQSKLVQTLKIKTQRLDTILNRCLKSKRIDLLNVDVEGLELAVLKSNNWAKFRPNVIVVENLTGNKTIPNYLAKYGYRINSQTKFSQIYVQK